MTDHESHEPTLHDRSEEAVQPVKPEQAEPGRTETGEDAAAQAPERSQEPNLYPQTGYQQPGEYGQGPKSYGAGGYPQQGSWYPQSGSYPPQPNPYQQTGGYPPQPNPYQQPGGWGYPPQATGSPYLQRHRKRRIAGRTILVPLLFYMIHAGLQTIVTFIYTIFISVSQGVSDPDRLYDLVLSRQSFLILVSGSLSIIIFAISLQIFNRREPGYLLKRKPKGFEIGASVITTFGAIGFTSLILIAIQLLAIRFRFWDTALENYSELAEAFGDTSGILWQVLAIVIIAPISEELLFRGIVCGELKRVLPDWAVILISGVFFAIIHMNVIQSTYVLGAGLVLSAVYIWSGSLLLPILMHMLYNFMGSTLPILLQDNEQAMIWLSNIEMIFVPIGIFMLVWLYNRHRQGRVAAAAA